MQIYIDTEIEFYTDCVALIFPPTSKVRCVCSFVAATYIIIKELHNKRGHAAVNADKEVDAGQYHIGRAGHTEDEGGGVHHRGDGPPAENNTLLHRQIREASDLIQTEPRKKVTVAELICTELTIRFPVIGWTTHYVTSCWNQAIFDS